MGEMVMSFIKGMGQALDLGGALAPRSSDVPPEQADYEALKSDWQKVGSDMHRAVEIFEQEHQLVTSSHGEEK